MRNSRLSGALCHQRRSRRRRFESRRQENHVAVRILPRNARGIERASNGPHVAACRLGLLERTRFTFRCIHGHAQHVAVSHEDDFLVQGELDGFVDVFFGADADRATGSGHQFDVRRDRLAQSAVVIERPRPPQTFMTLIDGAGQRSNALQPVGSGSHVATSALVTDR
jgi:hypothetical protein